MTKTATKFGQETALSNFEAEISINNFIFQCIRSHGKRSINFTNKTLKLTATAAVKRSEYLEFGQRKRKTSIIN